MVTLLNGEQWDRDVLLARMNEDERSSLVEYLYQWQVERYFPNDMSRQELAAVWELLDLCESINSMRDGVEDSLEDSTHRGMEGNED